MTTAGLVGGLGPESTIDYYRRILEAWERVDPSSAPSIVIDSLDVRRALRLVEVDRAALVEYLLASLGRLAGAGCSFAAITANTPHVVFDELATRAPLPLVSIVEVCAEEARRRGLERVALLGTRFTMESAFYPAVFARHGIEVVTPDAAGRAWVHDRYVGELLRGQCLDETRQRFVSLVARLRDEERVDGVVLGGTELPLLLQGATIADLPALDTTALHVASIVERLRAASLAASARHRHLRVAGSTWRATNREQGMDFDLTSGITVLERTPRTLRAMLAGLPAAWTDATEGPETWSPYVVVGHLIHGERTDWIPRARIILEHGRSRPFTPFDRFAQLRESEGRTLGELLDELARLRAESLATLAGWRLTDAQLALEGEHPAFGAVTLRQLLAAWVAHDLSHVAQISRVMAKQYREAVGPWRAYLPIMDR